MTARIYRTDAARIWSLLFTQHLATLSIVEQETMHRALHNSERLWAGLDNDRVLAVWGLISPTLLSDIAYIWLFTTSDLAEHNFTLIRHSRQIVQEMLEDYPTIYGHGAVGAPRSLCWLRWLGAEFGEPQGPFIPFTIKAKQQWQPDSAQSA